MFNFSGLYFYICLALTAIVLVIIPALALFFCFLSHQLSPVKKLVWPTFIVVSGPLGALFYFKSKSKERLFQCCLAICVLWVIAVGLFFVIYLDDLVDKNATEYQHLNKAESVYKDRYAKVLENGRGNLSVKDFLESIEVNQVNEATYDGDLPLIIAARAGNKELVKKLLEQENLDINQKNTMQLSALMTVVLEKNQPMIALLVEAKADIETQNGLGDTPLMVAIRSEDVDLVKYFLSLGANIHHVNHIGIAAKSYTHNKRIQHILQLYLEKDTEKKTNAAQ